MSEFNLRRSHERRPGLHPADAVPVSPTLPSAQPRRRPRAGQARRLLRALCTALLTCATALGGAQAAMAEKADQHAPERDTFASIAFHYDKTPLDEFRIFDVVVVDPDSDYEPGRWAADNAQGSMLYAYVSIGEVHPDQSYAKQVPAQLLAAQNAAWGGRIVDLSQPAWTQFLVEQIVAPLWARGYRGFFLDTADAHRALATTPAALQAQEDGLVAAVSALKQRFPQARLIMNRGFEVLPRIGKMLQAVAAESLYGRWDAREQRYTQVPEDDRQWLLAKFAKAREMGLQTVAIDYADPADRAATRQIAQRILADGLVPWVTDGHLSTLGIGRHEVQPRRVLVLHDSADPVGEEHASNAQRLLALPLQYLGYRVELLDMTRNPAPSEVRSDRFAAVVSIFERGDSATRFGYAGFLADAHRAGIALVFFNSFGLPPTDPLLSELGVVLAEQTMAAPLKLLGANAGHGFEAPVIANIAQTQAYQAKQRTALLIGFEDGNGQQLDSVATTPWGGFALSPYVYMDSIDTTGASPWIIDPIAFLAQALNTQDRFAPDVSTENGRRLLLAHIDGDGFASRAEIPGSPYASEVMLKDFLARYRVPHTVSVIVGEVAPDGAYPAHSEALIRIARRMFALPNVEAASHSFAHPFYWRKLVSGAGTAKDHLPIANYNFDLDREIAGSARWINDTLLSAGKRTRVFLWTGDCQPPAEAIEAADRAGLVNMNGGDTIATRANPSMSLMAALSLRKQGRLQVFAPNQNENVYTHDWTGPFYGFERVIETFELTDRPRRLKPVNIYYHTYSASKHASIKALHKIYQWALAQPNFPVYGSNYIAKVHDFETMHFGRDLRARADGSTHWRIAGDGALRTLRIGQALHQRIDWRASRQLLGSAPAAEGQYLHLGGPRAELHLAARAMPPPEIALRSANGRTDQLDSPDGERMRFLFTPMSRGELAIAHPSTCRVALDGKPMRSRSTKHDAADGALHHYQLADNERERTHLVSVSC